MHLSIFISVINQLYAQNVCCTISLFHASTCFEHMCSKHVEAWNKLIVKHKFCASSWLIAEVNEVVLDKYIHSTLVTFSWFNIRENLVSFLFSFFLDYIIFNIRLIWTVILYCYRYVYLNVSLRHNEFRDFEIVVSCLNEIVNGRHKNQVFWMQLWETNGIVSPTAATEERS